MSLLKYDLIIKFFLKKKVAHFTLSLLELVADYRQSDYPKNKSNLKFIATQQMKSQRM